MKRPAFILSLTLFLVGTLPVPGHATDKEKKEDRKEKQERKNYDFLSPKQRKKIRDVRDRYQELSPQKKRQLREEWQKDKRKKEKK
ncbi:MAG: DUF3106 domain-containing protein [Porticoccaceae bacterium]|nr:DUF3106 domain-containing protein [Porticoccaceae bacterium]